VVPNQDAWVAGAFQDSRIAFNDISQYGLIAADLGGIYICCNIDGAKSNDAGRLVSRTSIDHNRIHDSPVGSGVFLDNQSHGFVIAHNLFFANRNSGIQINGYAPSGSPGHNYDITINSNTFFVGQNNSIQVQAQAPGGLFNTFVSNNIFETPSQVRSGCVGGICSGNGDFGAGGDQNYYGNPGYVNSTLSPYDFHLYNGQQNRCSFSATPAWTDSLIVNTLCASGSTCTNPARPSFGAYNTNGYSAAYGADSLRIGAHSSQDSAVNSR
jgi:hypothetical protein